MLRFLYNGVIRLHPAAFRHRFGDEMRSIFDNAKSSRDAFALLIDAIVSLGRQRLGRPEFSTETASMAKPRGGVSSVPSFVTLDSFHPQTSAILDGLILSMALFCLTCFAIRYSWIHVLHIRIPEVQAEPQLVPFSPSVPGHAERLGEEKNKGTEANPTHEDEISPHLQVEPMPIEPGSAPSAFEDTTGSSGVASNFRVRPLQQPGTVHLNPRSYAGTYVCSSPDFMISVTVEDDGSLAVRIDDQPKRMMSRDSSTTFVIDGTDDRIEFDRSSDGVIHQLRLLEGSGQEYTAKRQ